MNGLHFMLFAGFLIYLCYFNVKEDFLKVIVGLNSSRCHCPYKRIQHQNELQCIKKAFATRFFMLSIVYLISFLYFCKQNIT
jgi:Na+/melibiose symporter-like transporter